MSLNCVICDMCNKDLSEFHSSIDCTAGMEFCDRCAVINIYDPYDLYDYKTELIDAHVVKYFISKNKGKNLCIKCDEKYDFDILNTINGLNTLIDHIKAKKNEIYKIRIDMLKKYINCFGYRFRGIDYIITKYAYEE